MRAPILLLTMLASCAEGALVPSWRVGFDDYSVTDFGIESYAPNPSPGSAILLDDDYYFAGSYPNPIGTLTADEPVANFERLVASYDSTKRIHFPLTTDQIGRASCRERV